MNDKERLQRIIHELEEYGLEDLTEHGVDSWEIDIWWLIGVIEKQEQQLQQAQAKVERYEKALREIAINCDTTPFNYIAKQALEGEQ
jgi:uncharacterized protein involved in exopolysaccharide biosynthesis